ncbi:MAG: hypothetical protein KF787_01310 [Phycisphaeraceae bacterium]|nr:hypothetical protein [Phycisphaerae bacterium]MBX3391261.1 hypothetical protein [Phycisphaeraceae bacterium]HRJ49945.1 hypothetical protein [Phycisphaerales bacterium]
MNTTTAQHTDTPTILGRSAGDSPEHASERARTEKVCEVSVPYVSGAVGTAKVELFRSVDDEDRGGVILRLTTEDGGSSFSPTFRVVENGVELHLTGDAEADALLRAIVGAIATDKGR